MPLTDIALGIDISKAKKEEALKREGKYSFEMVALEWYENKRNVLSSKYALNLINRLRRDIFPKFGGIDISDITPLQLLDVLRGIEERGAVDLAHRLLQVCGQIFRYAIISGKAERDISSDLKGALKGVKKSNFNS